MWAALVCGAAAVLSAGCGMPDSGGAGVATEVVYVDADGDPVPAPVSQTTTEVPPKATPERPAPTVTLVSFRSPDGRIQCSSGGATAGWGGYSTPPVFACLGEARSLGAPQYPCSAGVTPIGASAALGSDWVARGLCTGGQPWTDWRTPFRTVAVGDVVASGAVICTVPAADAVSCEMGLNGFDLSSSALEVRGNDVTRH